MPISNGKHRNTKREGIVMEKIRWYEVPGQVEERVRNLMTV